MAAAASPARRASSGSAVAKKPHDDPIRARTPTPADSDWSSDSMVSLRASRLWRRETTTRASAYSAPDRAGLGGGVGQAGPARPQRCPGLLQRRVVGGIARRLEGEEGGRERRHRAGHRGELGPQRGQVAPGLGRVVARCPLDHGLQPVGQLGQPVLGGEFDVGHDGPAGLRDREDVDAKVGDDLVGVGPDGGHVGVALDLGVEAGEAVDLVLQLARERAAVGVAQPHDRLGGGGELA